MAVVVDTPLPDWQAACVDALQAVAPAVVTSPARGRHRHEDVEVLVDLTGTVRSTAGAGPDLLWFRHGRDGRPLGEATALAETARGQRTVDVELLWSRRGGSRVVRSGTFPVSAATLRRSTGQLLSTCAAWPAQWFSARAEPDGEAAGRVAAVGADQREPPVSRGKPGLDDRWRRAVRAVTDVVGTSLRRALAEDRWTVGMIDAPIAAVLDGEPVIRWLPEVGGGRYLADPFGAELPTGSVVYAERMDQLTGRGVVVRLDEDGAGGLSDPVVVSAGDSHLAYPYLVRDGTTLWCVPDASHTGVVRAYRVGTEMPGTDDGIVLLDDLRAADPTIVFAENRWWLFCTRFDDAPSVNLYLFHADTFAGPWRPHPANPVKSDVRSSRPAGTPFVVDGRLYRPAQDCSRAYGGAIAVNRVTVLTLTRFAEEVVTTLAPDPAYPDGLHTLSGFGGRTLVDGRRTVWTAGKPVRRFRRALGDVSPRGRRRR